MAASEAYVTRSRVPNEDDLLQRDVSFHLGERESYDFDIKTLIDHNKAAPTGTFVCLRGGTREILVGDEYKEQFDFTTGYLVPKVHSVNPKMMRVADTLLRDYGNISAELIYAYDLQDARRTDYAKFFNTKCPIPVLQYHRHAERSAPILPLAGYHSFPSWNIPAVSDAKRFAEKLPKAYWRGALSGEVDLWGSPRGVHLIFRHPELSESMRTGLLRQCARFVVCNDHMNDPQVDAKFVIKFGSATYPDRIDLLEPLVDEPVPVDRQLECKYLLALDGYDGPSSFYWMLNTNSVVLRQASVWEMFGDCYFAPWIHYVPLAQDCSDLSEKIQWCEQNQLDCERIIGNAKAAWKILFDGRFQSLRQATVMRTLTSWMEMR